MYMSLDNNFSSVFSCWR